MSFNLDFEIVVKVQPEDGSDTALAIPRFLYKNGASYLILEGLNDFGLELVDFLVARGAKNIVLVSESKSTRAFIDYRISLWRGYGVTVTLYEDFNFCYLQNAKALLKEVHSLGEIGAIFDLQRIVSLSRRSSSSKYMLTKYLFEESKKMCPDLQQFVVFSICKDIRENVDDHLLREMNLMKIFQDKSNTTVPGLLVLLGPVSGISECTTENDMNVALLSISTIMDQMDYLIKSDISVVSVSKKSLTIEKVEKDSDIVEDEKSKFDKYINRVDPKTSRFQMSVRINEQ